MSSLTNELDNATIEKLARAHPYVFTLVALWYVAQVTFATFIIFAFPNSINMAVATCYTALVGIPSICVTVYQWKVQVNVVTGKGRYYDQSTDE